MRRWILTKLIVGSWGFPSGLSSKKSACNAREAGDPGLILGREDPLEKEMATHSSILVWKNSWTEETCVLQSIGLQSQT